jgi:hypothetical protein
MSSVSHRDQSTSISNRFKSLTGQPFHSRRKGLAHETSNRLMRTRIHIATVLRVPYMLTSAVSAVCTKSQEAYMPVCNEPVILLDLSLAMHTLRVELLSLLSIESSSGRKATMTSICHQNFWTKRFQLNPHNSYHQNAVKNLTTSHLRLLNKVCRS